MIKGQYQDRLPVTEKSQRTRSCKKCGAAIIWLKTFRGKNIPVEYDSVEGLEPQYDRNKHDCHFDNCVEVK